MDDNELAEQRVAVAVRERLKRLRGMYAYWLQFPTKSSKDLVEYAVRMFGIGRSQAYDDLHITQILLGSLQQASKEFMRWKINQDLEHDLRIARSKGDMRAVASIEKARILNNRTDKDDEPELEFDKLYRKTSFRPMIRRLLELPRSSVFVTRSVNWRKVRTGY